MKTYGYAFTTGFTFGFEFIDEDFWGGGWILHLFIIKILKFNDVDDFENVK